MAQLQLADISYRFGNGRYGLTHINLCVKKGEFLLIAGANGSGKTTFCRLINGLLTPTSGEVLLNGESISKNLTRARQEIGVVFQSADHQIVGETVEADVAFGPENLKLSRSEIDIRVQRALDVVGLSELKASHPHLLSGGEKKRLTIAGVLAMSPRILVLDEPFSNLDYEGTNQVLSQILALKRTGHTIIVISHDLEPVMPHADRLAIFQDGHLAKLGPPAELIESLSHFGIRPPCNAGKDTRFQTGFE